MAFNPNNFLHSLALWLAARPSPPLRYASTSGGGRQLWRNQISPGGADPAVVLRPYPGPALGWMPVRGMSVQVLASGTAREAVLNLAQQVFEALCDEAGHPVAGITITGKTTADVADGSWRIISVDLLQRPGFIGVDEQGRIQAVFNFDIAFARFS